MLPLPLPSVDSVPHFVYSGFFLSAFRFLSHLILNSPPIYPGPPLTCGFWIALSAFLFPPLWILDSGFQSLDFSGFSSPKPRIPLAKTTWIPESGLPFLGRNNLVIIDFFFFCYCCIADCSLYTIMIAILRCLVGLLPPKRFFTTTFLQFICTISFPTFCECHIAFSQLVYWLRFSPYSH